jgi:hypothetical protein
MNKSLRVIFLLTGLLVLALSGCKKDTPTYPSKATLQDYSGTWAGTLSAFKDNQVINRTGTIVFYFSAGGDRLDGILSLDLTYALSEIQFRNGIYYFQVLNSDTLNPFCQNWNLSGWAQLTSASVMHVIISGKECGQTGKEWVNYEGDFTLTSTTPDSTKYFSFAAVNHHWTYRVYTAGADSCQLDQQVDSVSGSVYGGIMTTTCNLPWGSNPFRWDVSPMHFLVLDNYSGNEVQYAFHTDQVLNKAYYYYPGMDTNIVTLLGIDSLYVGAGGFLCSRYRLEQRMHTDSTYQLDRGDIYISNRYGVIRYQSTLLNDTTDFVDQSLIQKNF